MTVPILERRRAAAAVRAADLLELTKPRITFMVVLTTAAGFILGSQGPLPLAPFFHALAATGLVASGASALNQVLERERDALMRRTAGRPLPAGRLDPDLALLFGVALAVTGLVYLALAVNLLTALLGALTLAAYLFVYTPLKPLTPLATVVGAVPGAVPPMMGWTAARGDLDLAAWALFGLLFLWQVPHFLAIAWIYREDYQRGGFPMLPVVDPGGQRTARQVVLYSLALLPVSVAPSALGLTGAAYLLGASLLGAAFLGTAVGFARNRTSQTARRLMLASVLYLPAILGVMLLDRVLG